MSSITSSAYPVVSVSKGGDLFPIVRAGQLKKLPQQGVVDLINGLTKDTLISLDDTPGTYVGQAGKSLVVNTGETGLVFQDDHLPPEILYISSVTDFAVQDATTITLETDKIYIPVAAISTSKRFVIQSNTSVHGMTLSRNITWTYTGTGDMFTGTDVGTFFMHAIQFSCPNANQIFNFSDTTPGLSQIIIETSVGVAVGPVSKKYGTFDSLLLVQIVNSSAPDIEDGITITGPTGILNIDRLFLGSDLATFTALDLGSAVISSAFEVSNFSMNSTAIGSTGIAGLAGSGNLSGSLIGTVRDCEFNVDIPLVNVSPEDVQLKFSGNTGVPDSVNAADAYLTGGTETITINTIGVFEEIGVPGAGGVTWASDVDSRFTVGADGVITYIGIKDISVQISGIATVEKVLGGSDEIEVRAALNWTAGQTGIEKSRAVTQNATPTSVPVSAFIPITTGDNIRMIFANNTTSGDINAEVTSISVKE